MLPGALLEKETRRMKFLLPERAADQVKSLVEVGTARGLAMPPSFAPPATAQRLADTLYLAKYGTSVGICIS